jgi:hypothetical protein
LALLFGSAVGRLLPPEELEPVPRPLGVMSVFLSCWIRLYGMVCLEVFGHLRFALADAAPMFEAEMRAIAEQVGIPEEHAPPAE